MISDEALRTLVGIIGNIICLFFFLSPVPTFVRIWKKGAVEDYSAMPYLATLFSCMIWTLYGLPVVHPGSILVLTISFLGVVIEIILLIIFLIFSDKKKRLKLLLLIFLELFVVALLATLSLTLFHTYKKRSLIVGVVGIFSSIIMYSSPLSIMKLVMSTKSVEFMPFSLSFGAFLNCLIWSTYALIRFDPFLLVPNGLGIVFGVAQLILYGVYYKSTKKIMKEKKGKEVILSDVIVVSSVNNNQPNKTTSTTTLAPPHNDSNKDQFSIV
ncbi:bidirectional sugar transporter SWEET4 isoform X1 [Cannabis sativa]|uniref:bidirectional sugar transporter SWEET4 isoform X1 n=1 Tax=Cannabis sativa TaxID=3483 RepID=UPI0029CA5BC4|nr:bidirectional sugar transporter SWEET4 isoform X1 [Cannabis sativa]